MFNSIISVGKGEFTQREIENALPSYDFNKHYSDALQNYDIYSALEADNLDEELAELENINSLSAAANKFGMGVNVSGPFLASHLGDISKIQYLEDIIVARNLPSAEMITGRKVAVLFFDEYNPNEAVVVAVYS